jgi:uncharacterized phage protein gp47/JayE
VRIIMPTYGATSTGFARKTYAAILDSIKARTRALVGAQLTLDDRDPFGAIIHATAEELDLAWQGLEVAYNAFDPLNAEDFNLFALGSLTGVEQLAAQKGECPNCTVNLDAGKTFAPGTLVAHAEGNPANRWVNRDAIISTTAGDYADITFVSEGAGSLYAAPSGSLTVIAQRVSGWNSITNLEDARSGKDAESADDFRIRREESLAIQGSASTSGIRADVAAVEGVIQVRCYENNTDFTVGGLPPHSCRVVVWDGSPAQASNDEIAQAIFDSKAAGITAYGSLSGNATDANGATVSVTFDRAAVVQLYCEVTVTAPGGASVSAVKSAIQAKVPTTVGATLVFISAKAAALSVAGVTDVPTFKLDTIDPPANTSANLVPTATQIYLLDNSNIDVTVA